MTEEIRISCTHRFSVYPKGYTGAGSESVWCVIQYKDTKTGKTFSAKGINLPCQKDVNFELTGTWEDNKKYGHSFSVSAYSIILPTSERGVISYLRSLKVGIGQEKAKRIYQKFQEHIWEVLENDPGQLTSVRGITEKVVAKLRSRMEDTKLDRELTQLFTGTIEMTTVRLSNLRHSLGRNALQIIAEDPYTLCAVKGFSFRMVDAFAKEQGFSPTAESRLAAGMEYIFDEAASAGHTCIPKYEYKNALVKELNRQYEGPETVSDSLVQAAINNACQEKRILNSADMLYNCLRYTQEVSVANDIARLLCRHTGAVKDVEQFICDFEKSSGIILGDQQREAVRNAFRHQVSIITGGPGTGKSTIISAVLYVFRQVFGQDAEPLLMAPTGRAARRMTEATGFPAHTMHSALNWRPQDNSDDDFSVDDDDAPAMLGADLIILDEASMADLEITCTLMKRVPDNARVVFVGDIDQLPSVGYGNVLYEMIRSKQIAVSRLDVIFRQADQSPIVTNAAKIRQGDTDLLRERTFRIYEEDGTLDVFKRACTLYARCVKTYGADNVILICPYRRKSDLNVDVFNRNLQHIINPYGPEELYLEKDSNTKIYANDRVMQLRNTDTVMNGDVGVVRRMERAIDPDDPGSWITQAIVEFNGDGVEHTYRSATIRDLDLAYCNTVHKCQGDEYHTVIIALSRQHKAMLRRNIVYTAVTRAKRNVAIITETASSGPTALDTAIRNDKTDNRYSLMADRINASVSKRRSSEAV